MIIPDKSTLGRIIRFKEMKFIHFNQVFKAKKYLAIDAAWIPRSPISNLAGILLAIHISQYFLIMHVTVLYNIEFIHFPTI